MRDNYLHIAVGVIQGRDGRILISERKQDCAYAGQWEFPGGKVEAGESVKQALVRELNEELGLSVRDARPLISLSHDYPDRKVFLDTWMVTDWAGRPESREGQDFTWAHPRELDDFPMLEANRPIVRATQLPSQYLITPECGDDEGAFLEAFEASLDSGVQLVRLRQTGLDNKQYEKLARSCEKSCRQMGATLILDNPELSALMGVGLHLSSVDMYKFDKKRLLGVKGFLAASCHSEADLTRASSLGCDFAVLGSVAKTASHPDGKPIGWARFQELIEAAKLPVYALGGMQVSDVENAWQAGGQGIAAISGLWKTVRPV